MGVEHRLDMRFVDRGGVELACRCLSGQLSRRVDQLAARAIVERDRDGHPAVAGGPRHRGVDEPRHVGFEGSVIAKDLQANAFLVKAFELALHIEF
jgi:hypothetical protein